MQIRIFGGFAQIHRVLYRGSPTSTVSTSTISTSTNFSAIGIKFVLVGLLCSKIRTSGNQLCSTKQYDFRVVRFFQNPKNRTKRGPPVELQNCYQLCINFCGLLRKAELYVSLNNIFIDHCNSVGALKNCTALVVTKNINIVLSYKS